MSRKTKDQIRETLGDAAIGATLGTAIGGPAGGAIGAAAGAVMAPVADSYDGWQEEEANAEKAEQEARKEQAELQAKKDIEQQAALHPQPKPTRPLR
ncbi:MAG: hypothetical protein QGI08_07930 [Paracoccaceae bacterium]|jgi:outer membrane lipoprotein SlyB|nr:hypothetical protein [Paracoccaceae bacterium]MDP7185633.1 hypothetical protein [Paracoccaceae bacterium]